MSRTVVTEGEDTLAQAKGPVIALGPEDRQVYDKLLARLDKDIDTLRPHLFSLARDLREAHLEKPFSSVLIDDCSARFIGLFMARAISPDGVVHRELIRPRKDCYDIGIFREELCNLIPRIGQNSLYVTELIYNGRYGDVLNETFRKQGVPLSMATLVYPSKWILDQMQYGGAVQVFSGVQSSQIPESVYTNNHILNGVIKSGDDKRELYRKRIDCLPGTAEVRGLLNSHSRRRLKELVLEFREED